MDRRTYSTEDRELELEVAKSTRVSSYLDNVYDAITTGNIGAVQNIVPDFAPPAAKQYRRGAGGGGGGGLSHETGGLSMNMEGLFQSSAEALGEQGLGQAVSKAMPPRADGKATFAGSKKEAQQSAPKPGAVVTENQFRAIKKYPQIVEFLGTERGTKIANKVLSEINTLIADQIEKNTQLVQEHAKACVAQKQFLHQFFQGDGWACKVTASGPFRGNEAFFFKEDEDKSFILRRIDNKYADVSADFNIIHDYRTAEAENAEE